MHARNNYCVGKELIDVGSGLRQLEIKFSYCKVRVLGLD